MDMYIALLIRLRADAAAALSKLIAVRHTGDHPVDPVEIEGFVYPGPTNEPIRYCARVRGRQGWLCGYAGQPCANEVEALCSLVERAHADLAAAGGSGLPLHLMDQLAADEEALAVYRREVPRVLAAAQAATEALDDVAELQTAKDL